MNCLNPRQLLAAWDGLLSEAEQQAQAAHLAQCARCQELEKSWREIFRLAQAAAPATAPVPQGSCPAEAELLDFVAQCMAETQRQELESHLAECRLCLWQVASLARAEAGALPVIAPEWRDAVRQAEALVEERPQTPGSWWLAPAWRFALASAAAVVLLVAGLLWQADRDVSTPAPDQAQAPRVEPTAPPAAAPSAPDEPALLAQQSPAPAQQPEMLVRSATPAAEALPHLLWPREGEKVARANLELRWQALTTAELYELTLLNRRGDVVWEAQVQADHIRVPDDIPLSPGEKYFIWVTAHLKGTGPVRSPSVAFEIEAPAAR